MQKLIDLFWIFLKLGSTSFGGPVAHLGYFREEFVSRRQWLSEHAYADLVALCQLLPGPTSSQVGMSIGLSRAGIAGALVAWAGFTLPSALALILFSLFIEHSQFIITAGWLHGLKIVACAVVAQALWGMGKTLAPDRLRVGLALLAAVFMTLVPSSWSQIATLTFGGLAGLIVLNDEQNLPQSELPNRIGKITAGLSLFAFGALLLLLPMLAAATGSRGWAQFNGFYRSGALVFGGGHVVLPLLKAQVVDSGWVSNDIFLAGYGAAQAVPGPLFSFAAFLGSVSAGWPGAILALIAIFSPGFLLVLGTLPFWHSLRRHNKIKQAMLGINAAVVGLLLAAFFDPVWAGAIHSPVDFCLAAGAFLVLTFWKWPPWLVVIATTLVTGSGIV